MHEVTRRDAMKFAAAVGATALGASTLVAQQKGAAEAAHPNDGEPEESKALPTTLGPRELFAVVDATGKLCRGLGAVSAHKLSTGQYEVIFVRDVRRGAYLATIGLCGSVGASPPGEITVVGRVSNVRGVFIETTDSTGKYADRGFHLFVINPESFA